MGSLDDLREIQREYEEAVDTYMNGFCMCLAAALYYKYGFQIEAAVYVSSRSNITPYRNLYHCWVVLPSGSRFDINGIQSYDEIVKQVMQNCDDAGWNAEVRQLTVEELSRVSRCQLTPRDDGVVKAMEDCERFLTPQLELIERRQHANANHQPATD